MSYIRKRGGQILPCVAVFAAFHLYFFFFIQDGQTGLLLYLDLLILAPGLLWMAADCRKFWKTRKEIQGLLAQQEIICRVLEDFENRDVAEHDVQVMEQQVRRHFQENRDLQDYVAKWCHELKLPLASALLMNEKIQDPDLRRGMREQLEKMNRQLGSMLMGCRLQSPLVDIQIKKVRLWDCVKMSVRNNQFFLITHKFELAVKTGEEEVYTDPQWLVYILDQLIGNAVKYGRREPGWSGTAQRQEAPVLRIWAESQEEAVTLYVEDHGQGIREQDIGRIFEKGYTGNNYHNGKYKSTGMGLYMVSQIADRLGHQIAVESRYGEYSRFGVRFCTRL